MPFPFTSVPPIAPWSSMKKPSARCLMVACFLPTDQPRITMRLSSPLPIVHASMAHSTSFFCPFGLVTVRRNMLRFSVRSLVHYAFFLQEAVESLPDFLGLLDALAVHRRGRIHEDRRHEDHEIGAVVAEVGGAKQRPEYRHVAQPRE